MGAVVARAADLVSRCTPAVRGRGRRFESMRGMEGDGDPGRTRATVLDAGEGGARASGEVDHPRSAWAECMAGL